MQYSPVLLTKSDQVGKPAAIFFQDRTTCAPRWPCRCSRGMIRAAVSTRPHQFVASRPSDTGRTYSDGRPGVKSSPDPAAAVLPDAHSPKSRASVETLTIIHIGRHALVGMVKSAGDRLKYLLPERQPEQGVHQAVFNIVDRLPLSCRWAPPAVPPVHHRVATSESTLVKASLRRG